MFPCQPAELFRETNLLLDEAFYHFVNINSFSKFWFSNWIKLELLTESTIKKFIYWLMKML